MSNKSGSVQTFSGTVWIAGWLFTIGFLGLGFWQGFLALFIWPYKIGVALAGF